MLEWAFYGETAVPKVAAKRIEAWFTDHDGDGEFSRPGRNVPYQVIEPLRHAEWILYTPKPEVISAVFEEGEVSDEFGLVGRPGLPDQTGVRLIRKMIGSGGVLYLGDIDPVDLMIYVWLRENLPQQEVRYLGLNDAFLQMLEESYDPAMCIPCASSEKKALAFLAEILPAYRDVVGSGCSRLLEQGSKIELEVLLGVKPAAAAILQASVPAELED